MSSQEQLSILDALENLNVLAEANSLEDIEVTEDAHLISHKEDRQAREVIWVAAGRDDLTAEAIRRTFRSVLHYLQTFYRKNKEAGDVQKVVEGINTIMILVGEATRKLEKFGVIFREKVTDFEEYKQLQHFYKDRVIRESFQKFSKTTDLFKRVIGEKAKSSSKQIEEVVEIDGAHLIGNLEAIKEDHHYELFFLKNEAGHHFFTYDLIRDMKLACDFGAFSQEYFGDDPLLQIKNWEDRSVHILAQRMLDASKRWLAGFYKEALRFLQVPMAVNLHKALMALMLAANPRNLIRQFSPKGCYRYFSDFQMFLREVLLDRDFQKFLLYAPPTSQPFFLELIKVVESLCFNLFTLGADQKEWENVLKTLAIRNGAMKTEKMSDFFHKVAHELTSVLKKHPNGPLFKTFDLMLQENGEHAFDPFSQGNIPTVDGTLNWGDKTTQFIRMPSPTTQEFIQKAFVVEEFLTYLRACADLREGRKHLIVNFQDRTSWREHARCIALEDLSKQAEFADILSVVTLAKGTDFYNQIGPYFDLSSSASFLEQMYLQLEDENTGYYFNPLIKEVLFTSFVDPLLKKIHETFFDRKDVLSQQERCDFIEITYQFLTLKIIELVSPEALSLLSKDGLDITSASTAGLCVLLGLKDHVKWSTSEKEHLMTVLFAPTLIHRERSIHKERLDRLIHMLKALEKAPHFWRAFSPLFEQKTIDTVIDL